MLHPRVLVPFLAITLIWGSTWLVIHDQLGVVPPSWSVAYRFLIGAATLFGVALVRREPVLLGKGGYGFAVALGLLQFALNFNFVYHAERFVTSGLVAVIFALLIVPNALFARLWLGQPVSRRFLGGSMVAILGVALLFIHEMRANPAGMLTSAIGVALALAGVLSASVSNVMQCTERSRHYPMTALVGWAMLTASLSVGGWAWLTEGAPTIEWRTGYIAGVFYLGVVASALAFTLYYAIIRMIGPAKAAYSSMLIPVIAMLLSTVFEGYRWSLLTVAGGVLALIGMVIALSARSPAR